MKSALQTRKLSLSGRLEKSVGGWGHMMTHGHGSEFLKASHMTREAQD